MLQFDITKSTRAIQKLYYTETRALTLQARKPTKEICKITNSNLWQKLRKARILTCIDYRKLLGLSR